MRRTGYPRGLPRTDGEQANACAEERWFNVWIHRFAQHGRVGKCG